MNNKKRAGIVAGIATAALIAGGTTFAFSDADSTGVTLQPNKNSGVTANMEISGTDVAGEAIGLDPDSRYISLYYGDMSTAEPGKQLTCADARTAALPSQWAIDGEWTVDSDGGGTLVGTAPRAVEDGVKTVSIRQVPKGQGDDPLTLFNPVQYPVVACGLVSDQPDSVVTDTVNQVPTNVTDNVTGLVPKQSLLGGTLDASGDQTETE